MSCPARIVGAIVLLALGSGCAPDPIYRPIKVDADRGVVVEKEPVMRADRIDVSSV
jgi:hypothetical protein